MIVGFFQLRLFARLGGIMLMRRPRAGGPRRCRLHHQQAVRLGAVRQNIMHLALIAPFPRCSTPTSSGRMRRAGKLPCPARCIPPAPDRNRRSPQLYPAADVDRPRRVRSNGDIRLPRFGKSACCVFTDASPATSTAQLAIAAPASRSALFQHPDIKADIAPTGALRRNMLDLSLFRDLASNDMALSFAD